MRIYIRMKKKAVIGIGTLIIFIAMILVAAVAAGVIIRTSGILQERAFAVGGEARKRLVTGMEVLEVLGDANTTSNTIADFEIYVRTRAGSRPVQLKTTGITFSTQNEAYAAELQHSLTEEFNTNLTGIYNSTWTDLSVDLNEDYLTDRIRVVNGTGDYLLVQFNVSGVDGIVNVSTGVNGSSSDERNISLSESKLLKDEQIYGFLDLVGNLTTSDNTINASAMTEFRLRQFPEVNVCDFDHLIPARFYCFESRLGDADTVLEPGELYVLKFKLIDSEALEEEEKFQFNFMPKDGAVTFLESTPPSVIQEKKVVLWPA